jgi:hypothetical protein
MKHGDGSHASFYFRAKHKNRPSASWNLLKKIADFNHLYCFSTSENHNMRNNNNSLTFEVYNHWISEKVCDF